MVASAVVHESDVAPDASGVETLFVIVVAGVPEMIFAHTRISLPRGPVLAVIGGGDAEGRRDRPACLLLIAMASFADGRNRFETIERSTNSSPMKKRENACRGVPPWRP